MRDQGNLKKKSFVGIFVRLIWMVFGYIPFVFYFFIIKNNVGLSKWDYIYWGTYISLISLRYVDYKFLNGKTADGKAATMENITEYTIKFFIFVLAFYIIAKYEAANIGK